MTERVRAAIAEMPIPLSDGRSILVMASFGIVVAPDDADVGFSPLPSL